MVLSSETSQEQLNSKFDSTSTDSNKKSSVKYPINKLRNLVISNTFTKYILLIDADFSPSINIGQVFQSTISNMRTINGLKCGSKCAFIIPAFDWLHPDQVSILFDIE